MYIGIKLICTTQDSKRDLNLFQTYTILSFKYIKRSKLVNVRNDTTGEIFLKSPKWFEIYEEEKIRKEILNPLL